MAHNSVNRRRYLALSKQVTNDVNRPSATSHMLPASYVYRSNVLAVLIHRCVLLSRWQWWHKRTHLNRFFRVSAFTRAT